MTRSLAALAPPSLALPTTIEDPEAASVDLPVVVTDFNAIGAISLRTWPQNSRYWSSSRPATAMNTTPEKSA